jgi:hypothetical protein
MALSLIDPPITPYSAAKDIERWLDELRSMETDEPDRSIEDAIASAQRLLIEAKQREQERG